MTILKARKIIFGLWNFREIESSLLVKYRIKTAYSNVWSPGFEIKYKHAITLKVMEFLKKLTKVTLIINKKSQQTFSNFYKTQSLY